MAVWKRKSTKLKQTKSGRRRRKKKDYPDPPRPAMRAAPAQDTGCDIVVMPSKRPPAKREEASPEKIIEILDKRKRK